MESDEPGRTAGRRKNGVRHHYSALLRPAAENQEGASGYVEEPTNALAGYAHRCLAALQAFLEGFLGDLSGDPFSGVVADVEQNPLPMHR